MRSLVTSTIIILAMGQLDQAYAKGPGSGLGVVNATAATFTEFFGEDLNGSEDDRLSSHPNADAARDQFLASQGVHGTEGFESFAPNSTPPLSINFGPFAATLTGSGTVINQPTGTDGSGRYPISGNQFFQSSESFTITMASPARAIGFYCVDAGDGGAHPTLSFALVGGGTLDVTVPNSTDPLADSQGAVLYYGLVSAEPFSAVTISSTLPTQDFFGFDDVTIAGDAAVPTVSEWGLVALTVAGLVAGGFIFIRRSDAA